DVDVDVHNFDVDHDAADDHVIEQFHDLFVLDEFHEHVDVDVYLDLDNDDDRSAEAVADPCRQDEHERVYLQRLYRAGEERNSVLAQPDGGERRAGVPNHGVPEPAPRERDQADQYAGVDPHRRDDDPTRRRQRVHPQRNVDPLHAHAGP